MVAEVASGMVQGVQGEIIKIQADVGNGLPVFHMIGSLSNEVKEARERVRTALRNMGTVLPARRISVNFAPADLRKYGTFFDLGVAVALLLAMERLPDDRVKETIFLGELSLDGTLCPISGVLPIILEGEKKGYRRCIVPVENGEEASFAEKIEVYVFSSLEEVCDYLKYGEEGESGKIVISDEKSEQSLLPGTDFSEVHGQQMAKRALEIAAAGWHNIFLDGPPGVGKSLLASCMPGIMPDMTREEMIEITMIYSVKGLLHGGCSLIRERPFRAPSHLVTPAGMFGGGVIPRPGEISLAHHGVLFLDELPQYKKDLIEMFRLPLEEHAIELVRKDRTVEFPADFLLVTAANPCPCGYYPNLKRCHCSDRQIEKYRNKISGPILDRIDLFVRCDEISYKDFSNAREEEKSALKKRRIEAAWQIQKERFHGQDTAFNSRMSRMQIEKYCRLDEAGEKLMKEAFDLFRLTGRSYYKVLKVARTIADLDHSEQIRSIHLEEALHFRNIVFISPS
ncbi:MAG: YifB family Mg chelatase-like AAA ATPase [Eubacterium sp.]|nr:YifB family Mg chelatase-like AAA ATPase [Eubacterium sp.]MDY5497045.1 YifB family Mg chelatase-like AAA ATPase [Anaerobutyricum sp.]